MPTIRTSLTTLALLARCCRCPHGLRLDELASRSSLQPKQPAATVQVPAGQRIAMETVGAGDITYECRAKRHAQRL